MGFYYFPTRASVLINWFRQTIFDIAENVCDDGNSLPGSVFSAFVMIAHVVAISFCLYISLELFLSPKLCNSFQRIIGLDLHIINTENCMWFGCNMRNMCAENQFNDREFLKTSCAIFFQKGRVCWSTLYATKSNLMNANFGLSKLIPRN